MAWEALKEQENRKRKKVLKSKKNKGIIGSKMKKQKTTDCCHYRRQDFDRNPSTLKDKSIGLKSKAKT